MPIELNGRTATPSQLTALRRELVPGDGIESMPDAMTWPAWLPRVTATVSGGRWDCNITPESLIDTTAWAVVYYVDGLGGSDANTGLSWAQRKKSIGSALAAAAAGGVAARIMVYGPGGPYYRGISIANASAARVLTAPVSIQAFGGRATVGTFDLLTWTLAASKTKVWQATRSGALRAFNPSAPDADGLHTEYRWVSDVDACEATEGSWTVSGSTVSVHPHGGQPATNRNARVYITDVGQGLRGNFDVLISDVDFEGGTTGPFNFADGITNRVVLDRCSANYSAKSNVNLGGLTVIDGAQILGCGLFAAFDSQASLNSKDGWNIHHQLILGSYVKPAALLVRSGGLRNGISPSSSNNIITSHDGCPIAIIGGECLGAAGAQCAFVDDGTHAWAVGVTAGMSVGDVVAGGSAGYGAFGMWDAGPSAYLWLAQCRDVGAPIGVYAGSGNVLLRDHRGGGARVGAIGSY